jgi:hypothetical protein
MKIRYFLKQTNKSIEQRLHNELVYAEVSNKFGSNIDNKAVYKKFQYSLDCYVKPKHFGTIQTKREKSNFIYDIAVIEKYKTHTSDLRQAISNFDASVKDTVLYFRKIGKRASSTEFKEQLELFTMRQTGLTIDTSLVTYLTKKIEYYKLISGLGLPDTKNKNTIDNYSSLLKGMINYNIVRQTTLTFLNIKDLYWDLWDVTDLIIKGTIQLPKELQKNKKPINKYGITTNTIVTYQSVLKQICTDAVSEGIEVSLLYNAQNKLMCKAQTSSKQYAVNTSDLLTIFKHQPSTSRLQIAKDYILFSSLVGMRIQSVLEVVNAENPIQHYDKKGIKFDYVHTIQAKTKTECHTPLFAIAKEVITRNGGTLPTFSKHTTTINKQIKDLYKEAGLTYKHPVTTHYYKEGAVTILKSVNTVVSSHATRKGFVTNLFEYEVPTITSKLVTHPDKKEAGTIDLYNKTTNEVRALRFYKDVTSSLIDNELYQF